MQGEHANTQRNLLLGKCKLVDIPPAPRGSPQLLVQLAITPDGITKLCATHKGTGKCTEVTISSEGRLAEEEVERLVRGQAALPPAARLGLAGWVQLGCERSWAWCWAAMHLHVGKAGCNAPAACWLAGDGRHLLCLSVCLCSPPVTHARGHMPQPCPARLPWLASCRCSRRSSGAWRTWHTRSGRLPSTRWRGLRWASGPKQSTVLPARRRRAAGEGPGRAALGVGGAHRVGTSICLVQAECGKPSGQLLHTTTAPAPPTRWPFPKVIAPSFCPGTCWWHWRKTRWTGWTRTWPRR